MIPAPPPSDQSPQRQAEWFSLTSPANTAQTTAPTRGALFCDANTLYVFFVSQQSPIAATRDAVSLFLDTSSTAGDGRESVSVSVDSTGLANVTWFRATIPAEKREDATPDTSFPVHDFPYNVAGLYTRVDLVDDNGHPAWTALLAIPFKNLPPPLKTAPLPGAHWKFNLIRNVTAAATDPGTRGVQFQSNLSPINVGAQPFTPLPRRSGHHALIPRGLPKKNHSGAGSMVARIDPLLIFIVGSGPYASI